MEVTKQIYSSKPTSIELVRRRNFELTLILRHVVLIQIQIKPATPCGTQTVAICVVTSQIGSAVRCLDVVFNVDERLSCSQVLLVSLR
jgi:hypothetical protein